MVIIQQMLVLFIMMLVGLIAYKKQIITAETSKKLSSIVVNISNPALILSSVIGDNNQIQPSELAQTMLIAIIMYGVLIAVSLAVPKILKADKSDYGIYRVMTVFSNVGFMGFPIISAVYGSSALLYASLFLMPYNFLLYTYAVSVIRGKDKEENISLLDKAKNIFNIGIVASIIAIILFMLKVKMPVWMESSITMLSNITAPLSMMVIGASFAVINLGSMLKDKKLLIFSVIKQFIIPIIGGIIIKQFIHNDTIAGVSVMMLCVPVGSMTAMFAQEYDSNYELTSKGVALTTVISVISVPLVSCLLG